MSIFEKIVEAVTPTESDDDRARARQKAQAAAAGCEWLALVLQHHGQIEEAFASVQGAGDTQTRKTAQERLGLLLTGHSIAEEVVLYPAMSLHGEKGHAVIGYTEQSTVKVEMAALEGLDPTSADYDEKLRSIREAFAHHVYKEEGTWYPALIEKMGVGPELAARYRQEFSRYTAGAESRRQGSVGGVGCASHFA